MASTAAGARRSAASSICAPSTITSRAERPTPYPAFKDLNHAAAPSRPPARTTTPLAAYQLQQTLKLALPIVKLFADAEKAPEGPAAKILRKIASVWGAAPDPANFLLRSSPRRRVWTTSWRPPGGQSTATETSTTLAAR